MVGTRKAQRGRIELPSLSAAQLASCGAAAVIDLRSPSEHAEDHVPGAVNVPLFDDEERALVGTLYRQSSPEAAFAEGERYVRANVGSLVGRIAAVAPLAFDLDAAAAEVERLCALGLDGLAGDVALAPVETATEGAVVFHCWRGGLRSRSVVALVRALGLRSALVLEGGYKAWRREVIEELERWRPPPTFVLRGLTGVGKTLVLREVEALRPGWTVDLEALAGHRSSLLGMVGLEPCSQRMFEGRLAARLRAIGGGPGPLVLEGESRKVGDAILPRRVWSALDLGTNLELSAPVERRVRVLEQDYLASARSREELARQLPHVEARMARDPAEPRLVELLERGEVDRLVRVLLERYYDPLYRRGEQGRRTAATFDATDPGRAAREIVSWIEAGPERAPGAEAG